LSALNKNNFVLRSKTSLFRKREFDFQRLVQHQFCFSKTFLRLPPRAEALTAALGTAGHHHEVQGLRPCTPL